MRVAITDDGSEAVAFLKPIIEDMGHVAFSFSSVALLLQTLNCETFDLIILDWDIAENEGIDALQWLMSAVPERPPVIIITDRLSKVDISDALNAGADDYFGKGEDRSVISARIRAMLRRNAGYGAFNTKAKYGKYQFNRIEQTVLVNRKIVFLTPREFELADLLFRNPDRTLSRYYIMETIWRTTAALSTRTLDMHISRVRAKLDLQPKNGFRIFTVVGHGYRLDTIAQM